MPTRKWLAATVAEAATVISAILISEAAGITTGEWVVVIGLASTRIVAWLTPNASEKAGVEGQPGQP